MWSLLILLAGTAQASDWGKAKPFARPHLTVSGVSVNGQWTAQGIGGASVGVRVRDQAKPHWLSITRLQALGMYGFTSGNLGADLRLGSFFGPDGKAVRLMTGPDVFYSGYGNDPEVTNDYYLAWSPGLDIRNTALFKIHKDFKITMHVTPGWAFAPDRAAPRIPVFTHVGMGTAAHINAGSFGMTIGVERQYNAFGTQDYIVLGASI